MHSILRAACSYHSEHATGAHYVKEPREDFFLEESICLIPRHTYVLSLLYTAPVDDVGILTESHILSGK